MPVATLRVRSGTTTVNGTGSKIDTTPKRDNWQYKPALLTIGVDANADIVEAEEDDVAELGPGVEEVRHGAEQRVGRDGNAEDQQPPRARVPP